MQKFGSVSKNARNMHKFWPQWLEIDVFDYNSDFTFPIFLCIVDYN